MVRIRGHHLLCILTFRGEGYNRRFARNFHRIVERLNANGEMLLVAGPDDLCTPLLCEDQPHCLMDTVLRRDELALAGAGRVLALDLRIGDRVVLDRTRVRQLREGFQGGEMRDACEGCQWLQLCTDIAACGFKETELQPEA